MLNGTLLAESLRLGAELRVDGLLVTRLSRQDFSDSVSAGQPDVWTIIEFTADDGVADSLGRALAQTLLADGGWYADFTVGNDHVVVFADKVFRYRRGNQAGRAQAVDYGLAGGVPARQLDWPD